MLQVIYQEQKDLSNKTLESLKRDFITIRSGKVSVSVLDNVYVNYYGNKTPLNQVGTILATDATTITIAPWEKPMLKEIETAIMQANIGVNPNNDGESIKLFFPPMTTEQRQQGAKAAKSFGEKAKVGIRNVRKDANDKVKKLEKDKQISEDESKKAHEQIQKITDGYVVDVDNLVKEKEAELLKV